MIAYNKTWLDALLIREKTTDWYQKGLVSDEARINIETQYPVGFYSPSLFVRIGLGVFCFIGISGLIGLLTLFFMDAIGNEAFFSLCIGLLLLFFLEMAIRENKHYSSGIDDVLLYGCLSAFLFASFFATQSFSDGLLLCWLALPFLALGSIRYLDNLCTLAALYCGLLILFLTIKDHTNHAALVLPFAGMLYAACIYILSRKGQQQHTLRFWRKNLITAEGFALVAFYVSGNYFVIQSLGQTLFSMETVPLPWLFWGFTFVVPALYMVYGLRLKDRLLLDLGMAGFVAGIATFRYYFNVMPLAWAATIAGAVFLAIAYWSIRYLHTRSTGYTYEPDAEKSFLMEIQHQVIDHSLGNLPKQPKTGTQFGGGQFGGGGAGSDF